MIKLVVMVRRCAPKTADAINTKYSELNCFPFNSSLFIDMSTVITPAASTKILKYVAKSSLHSIPSKTLTGDANDQLTIVYESSIVKSASVNQAMKLLFLARLNKLMKINRNIPTLRIISGIANPKLLVMVSSLKLTPFSNAYGV